MPVKKEWYWQPSPSTGHYQYSNAATVSASYVGQSILVSASRTFSVPPVPELPRMGLTRGGIQTKTVREWVPLRVMEGRSFIPTSLLPIYSGHPYPAGVPLPPSEGALIRTSLGDSRYGQNQGYLFTSAVWTHNGNPINWNSVIQTESSPAGSYRFIRLKPASAPPLTATPQQDLTLHLPLNTLNLLPPLKQDRYSGQMLDAATRGEHVRKLPRNRFLYVQYRWRGLPEIRPAHLDTEFANPSALSNLIPSWPCALVFNHRPGINPLHERFLAPEQAVGILRAPMSYHPVAAFPLATWRLGSHSDGSFLSTSDFLAGGASIPTSSGYLPEIALPRKAVTHPVLLNGGWSAINELPWHTVTLKFDLLKDYSSERGDYGAIWIDGHTSDLPCLLDLVAEEVPAASDDETPPLKIRHLFERSGESPVLRLRWNGGYSAPMDLCGFYVGLANPLFPDPDHDEIETKGYTLQAGSLIIKPGEYLEAFENQRTPLFDEDGGEIPRIHRHLDLLHDPFSDDLGEYRPYETGANRPPSKLSLARRLQNLRPLAGFEGPFEIGDPHLLDTDMDDLPDEWELIYFPSLAACDPNADPDHDFMANRLEFALRFGAGIKDKNFIPNPTINDSQGDWDGDGLLNYQAAQLGYEYWSNEGGEKGGQDPDGDGSTTLEELAQGTNPFKYNWPAGLDLNPFSTSPLSGNGSTEDMTYGPTPSMEDYLPPLETGKVRPRDTDSDLVPDELDAVPYDANLAFAKVPESKYIVIPLLAKTGTNPEPEDGLPVAINDAGHILLLPRIEGTTDSKMRKAPPRLWRGPGDAMDIPVPTKDSLPEGYQVEWDHTAGHKCISLAKDSDLVLANAHWLSPENLARQNADASEGLSGQNPDTSKQNFPSDYSGFHAFTWKPSASLTAGEIKCLPYVLPQISPQVPRLEGNVRYQVPHSHGWQIVSGGRLIGHSLWYYQGKRDQETQENGGPNTEGTHEFLTYFSWVPGGQGGYKLECNFPMTGDGAYSKKSGDSQSDKGWIRLSHEDICYTPESFALSRPKGSLIYAHSHNGHALAYKYGNKDADDPRVTYSGQTEPSPVPPANPLSKTPPIHVPDDYYIADPWSSSPVHNTWEKLPVTPLPDGKGYARAGALNDMPDNSKSPVPLPAEKPGPLRQAYTTGPLLVGSGSYFVKAAGGEWTSGPLIARPATSESHEIVYFYPHANDLNPAGCLNNRGEILGTMNPEGARTDGLWRNGRGHYLKDLLAMPGDHLRFQDLQAHAINDNGLIAASALIPQPGDKPSRRCAMLLFPLELKAFKRGSLNTPGAEVPAGTGQYGYETVMMENADSESSAASNNRDCDDSGVSANLNTYRKANDDDLVKIVLKWPVGVKPAGASLKLLHDGMEVDATQKTEDAAVSTNGPSRLNFYKADGTRITNPATDLQIADLANAPASSYLSKILTVGELTIFIEGADRFGDLPANRMDRLGGAQLRWEFTQGTTNAAAKLLVYRGGFLRFLQPAGEPGRVGKFEFWDGKGRVRHKTGIPTLGHEFEVDDTDYGTLKASWTAKSGKTAGSTDYRLEDKDGHTPPGWWRTTMRSDFGGEGQNDQVTGTGSNRKRSQGGYVRWKADDETDASKSYTTRYEYDASKARDLALGEPNLKGTSPNAIRFKYDMDPISPVTGPKRKYIQVHPDGKCLDDYWGGTKGCIGVQKYKDCIEVDATLKAYNGLKIKVQIE